MLIDEATVLVANAKKASSVWFDWEVSDKDEDKDAVVISALG